MPPFASSWFVLLLALTSGSGLRCSAQDAANRLSGPAQRGAAAVHAAAASRMVAGVHQNDGVLSAVAHPYRATFGERSVDYLPALGRMAPRAEHWQVQLASIHRGRALLLHAAAANPLRTHDRRRVDYAWPGVVERYEARADGLKQSFVLAAKPQGHGDLVVQLAIETTLSRALDGSLAWLNQHGHGVILGEVVGIAADGQRCQGTARPTAMGVELSLPAAFVNHAAYPLELDPLIGTASQAYPAGDCDFPDVAYDAFSNTYCIVWTQFFGGGATGVVGSVFLADTLTGYAFAINQTGDEDSVRVTSIGGTGLFVMVWVNYTAAGNCICGLAFDPIQAQGSNVFTLDGPANVTFPVVSGEATQFDDDCLVAWLDDVYGLLGCSVTINAQFQASATPLLQIAGGNVQEPAFSKQGGNPGLHLLTWVDRPPGQPGWIRAQLVDHDFSLIGAGAWIQNTPQNCGFPAVDGDGFKFLVAWEEQEVASPSSSDVRGRLLTVDNNGITTLGGVLDFAAVPGRIDYAADVALLGDRFGLAFMVATQVAPYHDDVFFLALQATGAAIGDALRVDVTPGTAYRYEHSPRLIGRRDGNPNTIADDGLLVFADQNMTTFDSDVGLIAVESLGQGGAIIDLGGGCGPGGLARSPGPFALGNPAFVFELYGAPPLGIPFLLLAPAVPAVTCGVCSVIQPLVATFVPNTAGTAVSSMALPGNASLVGFLLDFQFITFNVLYVGCPPLPGIAASNIVRATLAY